MLISQLSLFERALRITQMLVHELTGLQCSLCWVTYLSQCFGR